MSEYASSALPQLLCAVAPRLGRQIVPAHTDKQGNTGHEHLVTPQASILVCGCPPSFCALYVYPQARLRACVCVWQPPHQNTCSSLRPSTKCALAVSVVLGLGGHQTGPRPLARYGSVPGGRLGPGGAGAAQTCAYKHAVSMRAQGRADILEPALVRLMPYVSFCEDY